MSSPTNLQAEWARLIVTTVAAAGVTEVVVSPGSRSTPLVWAVMQEPRLRITDVIDERAAGFYALGLARGSDRPVALICTSGSALAHYFPAVIEASEAGVPLLVLSADRPPDARDAAANQTIRQDGLFGSFVRWHADLGVPEPTAAVLRSLRRRVEQAVRASQHDKPGPVHLNIPARKPLEPPQDLATSEQQLHITVSEISRTTCSPSPVPDRHLDRTVLADWAAAIDAAAGHGLIACGPDLARNAPTAHAIFALAAASGFPVLAETVSGLRTHPAPANVTVIGHIDPLLRAGMGSIVHQPRLIVQVGRPLVSTGWERLAALPSVRRIVTPWDWPDPDGTATTVVEAQPAAFLSAVADAVTKTGTFDDATYRRHWRTTDDAIGRAVGSILAAETTLNEATVVGALFQYLPPAAAVMVGNSLPVRHLDTWLPTQLGTADIFSQRGASGIDGLIAGAAGLHRAVARPTALLLGDVSFVHDIGGLQTAPHDGPALVIVVLHNGGGRIFEQLPVADRAPELLPHLVTEHAVHFAAAAAAFGLPHQLATDVSSLQNALRLAFTTAGTSIVEARVPPHTAVALARRLWTAAEHLVRPTDNA